MISRVPSKLSRRASPWRRTERISAALGDFLQSRQRYQDAAAAFRKAIELAPVDAKARLRLGDSLRSAGDRAGAAQAYRDAVQLNPELADAHDKLAQLEKK